MPLSCAARCFRHVIGEPLVQLGSSSSAYSFINRLDLAAAVIALLLVLEMLGGVCQQSVSLSTALRADLLYCFLHDETGCIAGMNVEFVRNSYAVRLAVIIFQNYDAPCRDALTRQIWVYRVICEEQAVLPTRSGL